MITAEELENLVRRIETLEAQVKKLQPAPPPPPTVHPGLDKD